LAPEPQIQLGLRLLPLEHLLPIGIWYRLLNVFLVKTKQPS
jgi:hypothetical protein